MKLSFSKKFKKTFEKYDKKLQQRTYKAICSIPLGDIKPLQGNDVPPLFRLRVSKYRIIFTTENEELKILKVDSRGDIYK